MPPVKCGECGAAFTWDSDVGSGVCLQCGTLQDAGQTVLSSQLDVVDSGRDDSRHFATTSTLKGLYDGKGWNLAGQGREVALARNKNNMYQFISDLASRVGHQGLAPRTQILFDQAMTKGAFRWGRKAKLVAGACAIIALRESHKGVTNQDVAYLLDEQLDALERSFSSVVRLLDIKLSFDEPSRFLTTISTYLISLLSEQPCKLPFDTRKALSALNISVVLQTAQSLSDLVARSNVLTHLPPAPTACGIFILALEGEAMNPLPHYGELAQALGQRFRFGKDVIMKRYKIIYEEIEKWLDGVPWLSKKNATSKNKKVARRVLVASGLKDVVSFQDALWKARQKELGHPQYDGISDQENDEPGSLDIDEDNFQIKRKSRFSPNHEEESKKKKRTSKLDAGSRYILFPLEFSVNSSSGTKKNTIPDMDTITHLITAENLLFGKKPTRLQILLSHKNETDIGDDELFEEGEMQDLMRTEEERDALLRISDWAQVEEDADARNLTGAENGPTMKANKRNKNKVLGGTSRVNMEALNRLLAGIECDSANWREGQYDEHEEEDYEENLGWTGSNVNAEEFIGATTLVESTDTITRGVAGNIGLDGITILNSGTSTTSYVANDNELEVDDTLIEEIEPWRPISPGRSLAGIDRYDLA